MKRVLSCVFISCCLALSACSSASQTSPDAASETEVEPNGGGNPEQPSALAFDEESTELGELRLGMVRSDRELPSEISLTDQGAVIIADLLYDGLTEAVGTDGRLRPGLATEWWANDELTEWTFEIDTDRIDSATVVEHLRSLLHRPDSPGISLLLDDVVSIDEPQAGQIQIVLGEPNGGFAWLLSGVSLSIVGEDGALTGRYDRVSDDANGLVIVPIVGQDGLPTIVISWSESEQAAYDQLTLGLLDAAIAPAASLSDAQTRFGTKFVPRSITRFYVINHESARLTDPRVQQAVLAAVDSEAIAVEGFSSPVFAIDGVVSPAMAGFHTAGCGSVCDVDAEAAASLVADAIGDGSISEGLTLALAVTGEDQFDPANAVVDHLAVVGLGAAVVEHEPQALASSIANGDTDLFGFGWVAGAGSVDAVIPQLFASDSPANGAGIDSTRVDELLATAAMIANDGARWVVLSQAQQAAMEEGKILPMVAAASQFVTAPHVSGLVVRADGSLDLEATE